MDIDKLEAGRELDALVAEKVMGIPLFPTWDDGMMLDDLPDYSTSISAAWEVADKFEKFHIQKTSGVMGVNYWAYCWHPDMVFQVCAPTAPLAICRAALKAITNTT